ncbi:small multi-drug export protein [Paenibacillus flagellatus]|uniref:DNA-binding protein n=1 Tax=Paenibacillus flagellatus TaxID=2211139 RepID=A0A2V5KZU7_9BACL|nr:small multi-drug export protein [Paenibacillus flagellatus]PYI55756.1 DNA-binding protein [Paenibacillus flagellatus]
MISDYLREFGYLAVFVLSALPWLESAAIVALAVAFGLNPFWSGVLAFAGNWLTVLLVVFLFDRWHRSLDKRRGPDYRAKEESKKGKRAYRIWIKYGLPGLAILGPLFIGTEIAAAFAMGFKAPRKLVLAWMTGALAFWTVLFAVAAHYGLGTFGLIRTDVFPGA